MKLPSLLSIENFKQQLRQVIARFPLPLVLVFLVTGLMLSIIFRGDELSESLQTLFFKINITSVVVFFLSIALTFLTESYKIKGWKKFLPQALALFGFGGIFYLFIGDLKNFNSDLFTYIALTNLGMIAFLYVAPFLKNVLERKENQASYFAYFYETSIVFLTSLIVGGALVLLGYIGIQAIFTLFGIQEYTNYNIYGYWAVISCFFVAPTFGLMHLPSGQPRPQKLENKFYNFLVQFIGIPFIFFYFFILYAYTVKVLLNFSTWPNGEVTWMVIGFSFFGYLLYIGSYLLADKSKFIQVFRRVFPYAVVPQVAMLFYAIYLRIAQYDLTMNRYFVVAFGIWLLGISLYFVISKKKYLGMISLTLALAIGIISVGPWGVYSYPQSRQFQLLLSNLEKAHILKEEKITPLEHYGDIDVKLSDSIYEGISYLCENTDCKQIKTLFSQEIEAMPHATSGGSSIEVYNSPYLLVQDLTSYLKVRKELVAEQTNSRYYQLSAPYEESLLPLSVEGYDILAQAKGANENNVNKDEYFTTIDVDKEEFYLYKNNIKVVTHSFKVPFEKLRKKREALGNDIIPSENLIIDMDGKDYEIKLLLDRLSILKNPTEKVEEKDSQNYYDYTTISGYALIKIKNKPVLQTTQP